MKLADVEILARKLMAEHLDDSWVFQWDNAKNRAGVCRFGRGGYTRGHGHVVTHVPGRPNTIGLSRYLMQAFSDADVKDTILHEIAHALAKSGGHDRAWKRECVRIGAEPTRCYSSSSIDTSAVPELVQPWVGTCPSGHTASRHQQPVRVASCPECHKKFDPRFIYTWAFHGQVMDVSRLHRKYVAEYNRLSAKYNLVPATSRPERSLVAARSVSSSVAPVSPRPVRALRIGDQGRVVVPGRFYGVVGTVEKIGPKKYHLRRSGEARLLAVPYAGVEKVAL